MKQVFEAVKDKNSNVLKTMFSKQALSDDALDRNLDALFNYIQGDIQSWESTGTYGSVDERNVDGTGNRKKQVDSTYILKTDKSEYRIAIYEVTIDTSNSDNVGIYSFCIISSEDDQYSEIRYWGNGKVGINIGK